MEACFLTITTIADGCEHHSSYEGKFHLFVDGAEMEYRDGQATVCIALHKGTLTVERRGDYTLSLMCENGKLHKGSIGIGGAEGEVFTQTEKLTYSIKEHSLLLLVEYELIVSGEAQKMKLRLHAKRKE